MVEHNDDFGPGAPEPAPLREDEPGPAEPDFAGLNPAGEEDGGPTPTGTFAEHATHEAPSSRSHHEAPMHDDPPKHALFPMLLGGVMLLALVAAWFLNKPETPEKAPNSAPTASTEAAAAPSAEAATPAAEPHAQVAQIKGDVDSLKADVEALRAGLKATHERIEAMPEAASTSDLKSLSGKVDELTKNEAALAGLPKKLEDLDGRVDGFDKSLTAFREEFETFRADTRKASEAAKAADNAGAAGKPEDAILPDSALEPAVALFQAGKYKEASDAFRKLTESHPNDARAWYYAALSRGSATKEWQGETARLAEKGVEREKAGTPDIATIDASFDDLNPNFNAWFGYYRKLAKAR
jgi:TolA-binding protein